MKCIHEGGGADNRESPAQFILINRRFSRDIQGHHQQAAEDKRATIAAENNESLCTVIQQPSTDHLHKEQALAGTTYGRLIFHPQ
jgi:hypothetical protein